MINSKRKGKVGELLFRDVLRMAGYDAIRGQQYKGAGDSPDIICSSLPIHWEVKIGNSHSLSAAFRQASDQCADRVPVVASKRDRQPWMVCLRADDFFKLIAR